MKTGIGTIAIELLPNEFRGALRLTGILPKPKPGKKGKFRGTNPPL